MLASYRSVLGVAKETTPGTAVAPTDFIPFDSGSLEPRDVPTLLEDTGQRGSMVDVYDHLAGPIYATFGWGGNVHADTFGFLLANILGDVATTGASAPYTHTFATKNSGDGQPVSLSLTDYDGTAARVFAGVRLTSLEVTFDAEGLLTYKAEATSLASSPTASPTASYTGVPPLAAWALAATIASSAANLEAGSLSIKRTVTPINTADGTQAPYKLFAGPVSVDGSLTMVYEAETDLDRHRNVTKPALSLDLTSGAGASLVQVKFDMTKVVYTDAGRMRGKDWVEVEVDIHADANTTDIGASGGYGAIKGQLKNAKPAATYV